jgi:hypothetical protein
MKKTSCNKCFLMLSFVLFFAFTVNGSAFAVSYFGYEQWGGTWQDANKTSASTQDDLMCWAAAASNVLAWGGWGTATSNSASGIFKNFQDHWTNQGGMMDLGWRWWLNGKTPNPDIYKPGEGWSSVDASISGFQGYWPQSNFSTYFQEDWIVAEANYYPNLMSDVEGWLRSGYGVALAVYTENPGGGHALTAWGFDYNDSGQYTGVWVTDSDDYKWREQGLKRLSLQYDSVHKWWDLTGDIYRGWYIGGVQALFQMPQSDLPGVNGSDPTQRVPLPEPGTMILLAIGMSGVAVVRLKKA